MSEVEQSKSYETKVEEAEMGKDGYVDAKTVKMRLILVSILCGLQVVSMLIMRQNAPIYLERIDAPETVIGSVVSAFAFIPLLISLPSGVIMDHIGYKVMVISGATLMILASLGLATLPGPWLVLVTQLAAGFANILVILATQAYVSNLGRAEDRTRHFAMYSLSFGAGFLVGPPIAGVLLDIWGFSVAFISAGIVSAIVALLAFQLDEVAETDSEGLNAMQLLREVKEEVPQTLITSKKLLRKPLVQLALGVSVCVLFIMTLRTSFYLVHLEHIGLSSTRIGILVATMEAFALVFRPFLDPLIKRFGAVPILVTTLTIGGIGISIVPIAHSFSLLLVAAILHGITPAFSQPISMIMMSKSAPDELQGTAMGLRQTANQAPLFLGPLFFGAVATWSMQAIFIISGVILVGGAVFLYMSREYVREALENFS